MKQIIRDLKPWVPLIALVSLTALPLILFGLKWWWGPPIFGFPLPLPIPQA